MSETFATVGWDSDKDEWAVCVGERIDSRHNTKQNAIDAAKEIGSVNSVMAFTKGNSNMETIRC